MYTFKRVRNIVFIIMVILCAIGEYRWIGLVPILFCGFMLLAIFAPIFFVLKDKIDSKQIIREIQSAKPVHNKLEKDFLDAFNILKDTSKSIEIRQQALETIVHCARKGYEPATRLLKQLQAKNNQ